jgi:hypothetical protein
LHRSLSCYWLFLSAFLTPPMKRFFVVLLLVCFASFPLRAEPLGRVIEVTAVPGWHRVDPLESGEPQPPVPILKYVPVDGRNAAILLSLLPANVPGHEVTDLDSLKRLNLAAARRYLPNPADKPAATELKVPGGIGVLITSEDPALAGKPVPPNEFRIVTTASILLDGGHLVHAKLFYDELNSADFKEGIKILLSAGVHSANPPI